jgi:quinol monooxygenase YgiN
MTTMFVRLTVEDFDQWKAAYDDFDSYRRANGVTGAAAFQDPDDPNSVTAILHFDNMDAALAFANSGELRSAMQNAGVSGPPEIWFGEEVD